MESNGKYVDRNGNPVDYQTGPIIWGEPGTNGQHAFYQLIHQGTKLVPCDFIAPAISHNPLGDHHAKLLSNFFAQTEALAFGKSLDVVEAEFAAQGKTLSRSSTWRRSKCLKATARPTRSCCAKSPRSAWQPDRAVRAQDLHPGAILNIFTFDQWGVELGKQLANRILPELAGSEKISSHDSSTNALINRFKEWR